MTEPVTAIGRVRKVREQIHALTGCEPVTISGLAHLDSGWEIHVDVVELRRVPETASLLATYRVTTDDAGDVTSYERLRRFNRSKAD
jgi:gas vesicle protein GvpO